MRSLVILYSILTFTSAHAAQAASDAALCAQVPQILEKVLARDLAPNGYITHLKTILPVVSMLVQKAESHRANGNITLTYDTLVEINSLTETHDLSGNIVSSHTDLSVAVDYFDDVGEDIMANPIELRLLKITSPGNLYTGAEWFSSASRKLNVFISSDEVSEDLKNCPLELFRKEIDL